MRRAGENYTPGYESTLNTIGTPTAGGVWLAPSDNPVSDNPVNVVAPVTLVRRGLAYAQEAWPGSHLAPQSIQARLRPTSVPAKNTRNGICKLPEKTLDAYPTIV